MFILINMDKRDQDLYKGTVMINLTKAKITFNNTDPKDKTIHGNFEF